MTAYDSSGEPTFRAIVRRYPPCESADLDAICAGRCVSGSCGSVGIRHQRMRSITTKGEFVRTGFTPVPRANRHEIEQHLGAEYLSFVPA